MGESELLVRGMVIFTPVSAMSRASSGVIAKPSAPASAITKLSPP